MTSGRKRSPRTANAVSISLTYEEEKRGKKPHHVAPIPDQFLVRVVRWDLDAEGTGDVEHLPALGCAIRSEVFDGDAGDRA